MPGRWSSSTVVGEPARTATGPNAASSAATAWARASEDDSTMRFMGAGAVLEGDGSQRTHSTVSEPGSSSTGGTAAGRGDSWRGPCLEGPRDIWRGEVDLRYGLAAICRSNSSI